MAIEGRKGDVRGTVASTKGQRAMTAGWRGQVLSEKLLAEHYMCVGHNAGGDILDVQLV